MSARTLLQRAARLPRNTKALIMVLADAVLVPLALWCAIALRVGAYVSPTEVHALFLSAALFSTIPVFGWLGLYKAVVRHSGARASLSVVAGASVSALSLEAQPAHFESVVSRICLPEDGSSLFCMPKSYLKSCLSEIVIFTSDKIYP